MTHWKSVPWKVYLIFNKHCKVSAPQLFVFFMTNSFSSDLMATFIHLFIRSSLFIFTFHLLASSLFQCKCHKSNFISLNGKSKCNLRKCPSTNNILLLADDIFCIPWWVGKIFYLQFCSVCGEEEWLTSFLCTSFGRHVGNKFETCLDWGLKNVKYYGSCQSWPLPEVYCV